MAYGQLNSRETEFGPMAVLVGRSSSAPSSGLSVAVSVSARGLAVRVVSMSSRERSIRQSDRGVVSVWKMELGAELKPWEMGASSCRWSVTRA